MTNDQKPNSLLLLATIILAALLRFAVSPSSVDDIPGPLLDALATVAIVFRFFDHLSGALLVLTFLALARNLHKAGTGIYPAKRATLPLRILATLLLPAAVAEFIGEQYNFWHPFSSGSGLGLPAWYVKDLDAAISYSLLACAIGVAVLAVWSAKRVRSGLMFTAPEAPALRGTSKRLVVAAVLHLLPWVWQAVMVSIDLSFVGTMGTGSDMIGNVLRYWVRLGVMALLYTVGKWDIREGVKDGQGAVPAMGTGWRPADNHVSVQV